MRGGPGLLDVAVDGSEIEAREKAADEQAQDREQGDDHFVCRVIVFPQGEGVDDHEGDQHEHREGGELALQGEQGGLPESTSQFMDALLYLRSQGCGQEVGYHVGDVQIHEQGNQPCANAVKDLLDSLVMECYNAQEGQEKHRAQGSCGNGIP